MEHKRKRQSKNREERLLICHQVVKRLEELAHFKGETITELQKSLDLSSAYFSASKRGGGIFGADVVVMVLDHYRDLSPDWLLFGSGSMLRGGTSAELKAIETAYKANKAEKDYSKILNKTKKIKSELLNLLETTDATLRELSESN